MIERRVGVPEWSVTDMVLVLLGGVIAAQVAAAAVFVSAGASPGPLLEIGVVLGVQSVGSLGVLAWLSQRRGTGSWRTDFGLTVRFADGWALLMGFGLQILVALLSLPLIERFGSDDTNPQQAITAVAEGATGWFTQAVILVMVGIVAPVVEEVMWRGMLLPRLLRSMRKTPAIVVQAAAFAGIHLVGDPSSYLIVPGLFLIGLVLGLLAARSGDLSLAILTHAGVNLTAAVVLLFGDRLQEMVDQVETAIHLL